MRHLTRDEIASEALYRLILSRGRNPSRLDRELVALIADIVELGREIVPECYTQHSLEYVTPPTKPGEQ